MPTTRTPWRRRRTAPGWSVAAATGIAQHLQDLVWSHSRGLPVVSTSWLLPVVLSWGLGEYVTRSRRLAVSSTLLFLAYILGVFVAAFDGGTDLINRYPAEWPFGHFLEDHWASDSVLNALFAITLLSAALIHWARFRVPMAVGAGAFISVLWLSSLLLQIVEYPEQTAKSSDLLVFLIPSVAGIAVFVRAMALDVRDVQRQTRDSDVAFWLHLVAALFIVGPIGWYLTARATLPPFPTWPWNLLSPIFLLLISALFAVFSLAINRCIYTALSCIFLVSASIGRAAIVGHWYSVAFPVLLVAGCGVIVGEMKVWNPARTRVLNSLPASVRARLPASLE